MWTSTSRHALAALGAGLLALAPAGSARAQACPNTCVGIHENALNEMMAAFGSIQDRRRVIFRFMNVVICDEDAETTVEGIRFDVAPNGIQIGADARTEYCGVSVSSQVTGSAEVRLDPSRQHLLVTLDPDPVQPQLSVPLFGFQVPVPIPPIDLAPELRLDPIPVRNAFMEVRTGPLTRSVRVVGRDPEVLYRNDVVEIRGELERW